MSMLEMRYDKDLNAVVVIKNKSYLGLEYLVPVDGKEYSIQALGMNTTDFQETEQNTIIGLGQAIKVSTNLGNGTISAVHLSKNQPFEMSVNPDGFLVVDEEFASYGLAKQLITIRSRLSSSQIKIKYSSLVKVMCEYEITEHLPSVILTHSKYIDFTENTFGKVKKNDTGLSIYCGVEAKKDVLEYIEFIVDNSGEQVTILVDRYGRTADSLQVNGAAKHLEELGLTVADIVHHLPIKPYLQSGVYFIELGNEVIVTINRLGIIQAYSSEEFANRAPSFIVINDSTIEQIGTRLKSRVDVISLLTYGLLASFNRPSHNSILHILECYSIEDGYKDLMRVVQERC